jgi:hypothetical protein
MKVSFLREDVARNQEISLSRIWVKTAVLERRAETGRNSAHFHAREYFLRGFYGQRQERFAFSACDGGCWRACKNSVDSAN